MFIYSPPLPSLRWAGGSGGQQLRLRKTIETRARAVGTRSRGCFFWGDLFVPSLPRNHTFCKLRSARCADFRRLLFGSGARVNETAPPQVTAAPAESTAPRLPAAPVRCDLAPLAISAAALRCSDRVLRQAHPVKERRRSTIVARRDAACRQARALVTACSTRTGSTGTMASPPPTVDLYCVWCRLAACMLA